MTDEELGRSQADTAAKPSDVIFKDPVIEMNELRTEPVPHRYVHGGFRGQHARFSFYFPRAEQYGGRFFHNTYPLAVTSDIAPFPIDFGVSTGDLGFTFASGAYYVQTNNGGAFRSGADPAIAAYLANAAAAEFSRTIAADLYGAHRPFGYLFGGSGGAYQTIGAAEHTRGVWDGFMPFVLGCNNAVPSLWAVRLHALRVLRRRGKWPAVMDAINPGGSGDMLAGLDDEERAALIEVTRMGYPPRGWYNHETLHHGYFDDVFGVVAALDPTYAEDFWSKPGYLGADAASSIHADRFAFETAIREVSTGQPFGAVLSSTPERDLVGTHLRAISGAVAGEPLHIAKSDGDRVEFASTTNPTVLGALRAGDRVRIDNDWLLAAQTYQRHQVPPNRDEYGWDQFRDDQGEPLYPQRDLLIGHSFALNGVGALLNGDIRGKMLLVQATMDVDALAWCADWYRSEVKKALGSRFEENFALWFVDHAQHDNPKTAISHAHAVPLTGPLQQGLRDLARWVEQDVKPSETHYRIAETQVELPTTAFERGGIQPVVRLSVNGADRVQVAAGTAVTFTGEIEVPPGAGAIVAAEWDFEGSGSYVQIETLLEAKPRRDLTATHIYPEPGTFYAGLRGTSERHGDLDTPYARVQDLARIRVVVI